jgi:hypothetical protein
MKLRGGLIPILPAVALLLICESVFAQLHIAGATVEGRAARELPVRICEEGRAGFAAAQVVVSRSYADEACLCKSLLPNGGAGGFACVCGRSALLSRGAEGDQAFADCCKEGSSRE